MKNKKKQLTKHHLIPKERVKLGTVYQDQTDEYFEGILHLWRERHDYWHLLFHNLTLHEIILILQRIEHIQETRRMKHSYDRK